MAQQRLYLSPPHMSGLEAPLVQEVFASNWIALLGAQVDAFGGSLLSEIRQVGYNADIERR